jgi:hypothetical protein
MRTEAKQNMSMPVSMSVTESMYVTRVRLWRAVYAPGDGQTSPVYSSHSVQCLYINHLLSVNKLVLSYLLLRL